MWNYVGIVRTDKRLKRALNRVELLKEEVNEYYSSFKVNNDLIELRNLIDVAELTVKCALKLQRISITQSVLKIGNKLAETANKT